MPVSLWFCLFLSPFLSVAFVSWRGLYVFEVECLTRFLVSAFFFLSYIHTTKKVSGLSITHAMSPRLLLLFSSTLSLLATCPASALIPSISYTRSLWDRRCG